MSCACITAMLPQGGMLKAAVKSVCRISGGRVDEVALILSLDIDFHTHYMIPNQRLALFQLLPPPPVL